MTNKKLAMIVVTLIMQSHLHMISIAENPTKNKQNKYVSMSPTVPYTQKEIHAYRHMETHPCSDI